MGAPRCFVATYRATHVATRVRQRTRQAWALAEPLTARRADRNAKSVHTPDLGLPPTP